MNELFARDYEFALATSNNNIPSVRFVDTYFDKCCFYIVTYANSKKVKELEINKTVSLCNNLYSFSGIAYNIGHPLKPQNSEIREKLIRIFEPWYFKHNNENDENMCYVKVELTHGFTKEHENVYYSKDLSTCLENQTAEDITFTYRDISKGQQQYIVFLMKDIEVGGAEIHYLAHSDICYLRWIFIKKIFNHQGRYLSSELSYLIFKLCVT